MPANSPYMASRYSAASAGGMTGGGLILPLAWDRRIQSGELIRPVLLDRGGVAVNDDSLHRAKRRPAQQFPGPEVRSSASMPRSSATIVILPTMLSALFWYE